MTAHDNRMWWFCGARAWPAVTPFTGRSARNALAAYRRWLIATEVAQGRSKRRAIAMARDAGLRVTSEQMCTLAARELYLGWQLAWAVSARRRPRWTPSGPMAMIDARKWLTEPEVLLIVTSVDRFFARTHTEGAARAS